MLEDADTQNDEVNRGENFGEHRDALIVEILKGLSRHRVFALERKPVGVILILAFTTTCDPH